MNCIFEFKIGKFFKDADSFRDFTENYELPLPTYIYDHTDNVVPLDNAPVNLNVIRKSVGMLTLQNLTIAFINDIPETLQSEEFVRTKSLASVKGYRGCDIMLSTDWPKDVHQFLSSRCNNNFLYCYIKFIDT